jgi:glycosyltransferase involved in cell wall biosynthesis
MTMSPKVIAVVPAHNEARTVEEVVRTLRELVSEVVVVDDASNDGTANIAAEAGAVVLRNEKSLGYDGALNRGFAEAALRGAEIIVTFDADGEHDAADIPRILAPILASHADVVVGQRPVARHWGERLFAIATNLRFGIRDPLCGLKAYRREVYERVGFFDSVRSIGTELMVRALKHGFTVSSIPIALHARQGDASRFYAFDFQGNLRIVRAMFRVLFI